MQWMSSRLTQPTYTFDKRDPFRFATALNLPHPPTDYFPRQYISKQTKLAVYDRVLHAPLRQATRHKKWVSAWNTCDTVPVRRLTHNHPFGGLRKMCNRKRLEIVVVSVLTTTNFSQRWVFKPFGFAMRVTPRGAKLIVANCASTQCSVACDVRWINICFSW